MEVLEASLVLHERPDLSREEGGDCDKASLRSSAAGCLQPFTSFFTGNLRFCNNKKSIHKDMTSGKLYIYIYIYSTNFFFISARDDHVQIILHRLGWEVLPT